MLMVKVFIRVVSSLTSACYGSNNTMKTFIFSCVFCPITLEFRSQSREPGDYGGGQASQGCPDGSMVMTPSCVVRAQSNVTLRLHVSDVFGRVEVQKGGCRQ